MVVTCEEMRRAEEAAFARGITAEALMDEAGRGIAGVVRQFHWGGGECAVFCGKGHNAGDALVAAKHLAEAGWRIDVRLAAPEEELAPLTAKKLAELRLAPASHAENFRLSARVVLDGLLGLGAHGEPRGAVADAIREVNRRRAEGAWVLAVDLPSGLDGDTGRPAGCCIEADVTAAIAAAKRGLLADEAVHAVGRLAVIPLGELEFAEGGGDRVATAAALKDRLPPRRFDLHKGDCGRVGIVAGSPGFTGAGRLCGAAAVRAGAGLVTLYALPEVAEALAVSSAPEVMVRTVSNYREVLEEKLDVLGIGPGLGMACAGDVMAVVREAVQPVVVDADALNILAGDMGLLKHCAGPRLLTPHPGEMERMYPQGDRPRREWTKDFLAKYPVTLLLKGSRTVTGSKDEGFWFNTTGNPGMASGGMGDVLTGVCAALAAQRPDRSLLHAGVLGAWLCGRAAEIGVFGPLGSPESLCASQVIARLGGAFGDLRASAY